MDRIERMKQLHENIEEARSRHDYDDIFYNAEQMYELASEERDEVYLIISCYHLGNVYFQRGNYDESLNKVLEGIRHGEVSPFPFYQMILYNLGGIVYGTIGDEITSVEYTLKAYYIALEHQELDFLYIILNNLGVIFLDLEYYDLALEYFLRSFEERNVTSMDQLRFNDGSNIINLLGSCVYLNNAEEYRRWLPYYEAFHDMFHDPTVESDFMMYQVLLAVHRGDLHLEVCVSEMLDVFAEDPDYLHTFKNLLKVLERFIHMKEKKLCEIILEQLENIINKYPKYRKISKLNECYVKYYLTFHDDDRLMEALLEYYHTKEEESSIMNLNVKQSILTKIDMEEILYRQNIILKSNEDLRKKVEIEEFTKVLNKSSFVRYVKEELMDMHEDQYVCLCVIDIDKFKSINDSRGHMFGDKILLEAVNILKQNVREHDYIGRIGGDEFCIFMKNILSLDYVQEKADHIIHQLFDMRIDGEDTKVSASLGICCSEYSVSYEEMFEEADQAMYEAKNDGGNQYRIRIFNS